MHKLAWMPACVDLAHHTSPQFILHPHTASYLVHTHSIVHTLFVHTQAPALVDMKRKLMERNVAEEIAQNICDSVCCLPQYVMFL